MAVEHRSWLQCSVQSLTGSMDHHGHTSTEPGEPSPECRKLLFQATALLKDLSNKQVQKQSTSPAKKVDIVPERDQPLAKPHKLRLSLSRRAMEPFCVQANYYHSIFFTARLYTAVHIMAFIELAARLMCSRA